MDSVTDTELSGKTKVQERVPVDTCTKSELFTEYLKLLMCNLILFQTGG